MKFTHKFVPIQSSEEQIMFIVPCEQDVLYGKNTYCFRHSGNQSFRMLIAENVAAYKMAPTKKLKMHIVITIVDTVIFRGGRFLRQDSQGHWKDGGITLGKRKVGNAFRDAQRGRLRLTVNSSADSNACDVTRIPDPEKDDNKAYEPIHQYHDFNFESLPESHDENKYTSHVCLEKHFVSEPTMV
jgi:hypothetical protein